MTLTRTLKAVLISTPLLVGAHTVSAASMADELMSALKSCGADAKTMKAAQDMIKKSKGKPSDNAIDDFIDSIDSDKIGRASCRERVCRLV